MTSPRKSQRPRRDLSKVEATPTSIEEEPSPSRPAKRRKKVTEEEPLDGDLLVSRITQHLRTTDEPVQASKDHANSIHEANPDGVKAYAKVAAQDWTFYITKLVVNIGRAPETMYGETDDENQIHIDLGPAKIVSRNHAVIRFDTKEEEWLLDVVGRNGVKVDGTFVKSTEGPQRLSSGEVLEIGGVEMMFVLPTDISSLNVNAKILERCGLSAETIAAHAQRRRSLVSSAPQDLKRPGTPPSTQGFGTSNLSRTPGLSTPAPIMVGADGVDLSQDENQHIKPQFSYAQMITQAIINSPDGRLNLSGIYDYIMTAYSYYRHQQPSGWQNSIRHNLSLNKNFEKVARSTDEPGKGMKWQIVPEAKDEMVGAAWRSGRGGHRGSSVPSSPNQLNYITQGPRDMASRGTPVKRKRRSSLLVSPPQDAPALQSTPDRRAPTRNLTSTFDGSPLPRTKKKSTTGGDPLSSFQPQSPTLTSSYYEGEGASFVTPAPPRVHPKLAPPSTAQRPSQHMPTSSPAPFWRYADIGSTPLKPYRPYEASPSKAASNMPPAASSSPAPLNKSPGSSPTQPQAQSHAAAVQAALAAPDEEETFDLTKGGLQSIGSFHAPRRFVADAVQGK